MRLLLVVSLIAIAFPTIGLTQIRDCDNQSSCSGASASGNRVENRNNDTNINTDTFQNSGGNSSSNVTGGNINNTGGNSSSETAGGSAITTGGENSSTSTSNSGEIQLVAPGGSQSIENGDIRPSQNSAASLTGGNVNLDSSDRSSHKLYYQHPFYFPQQPDAAFGYGANTVFQVGVSAGDHGVFESDNRAYAQVIVPLSSSAHRVRRDRERLELGQQLAGFCPAFNDSIAVDESVASSEIKQIVALCSGINYKPR